MKSYRKERIQQLRDDMRKKHVAAGKVVLPFIRVHTPIATPVTAPGDPHPMALWRSIKADAHADYVDFGTDKKYGIYVHQGTRDYAHGMGGWTEAEAREFDSLRDTGDREGPLRGIKPRPFLVNGLLDSRSALWPVYSKPIN